jgi:hypothetical protein
MHTGALWTLGGRVVALNAITTGLTLRICSDVQRFKTPPYKQSEKVRVLLRYYKKVSFKLYLYKKKQKKY